MIQKVLVANRGEIAVRVFMACREMGIKTVAIYSEADANSMHVAYADESVCVGPAEPSRSYLKIEAVIEAALKTGADAIHPGYGFLSERPEFSEACQAAGIIFIGPSGAAMRRLGEKIDAKKLAVACGVPITPGFFEPGASVEQISVEAERIGYPVMLKASAGGGGRGMRIVRDSSLIQQECKLAMDEAMKAFGSDAMMVEKLVEQPRHIEVQILADQHNNVACLFERECSLQRRHQKVLEESPSPVMNDQLWEQMKDACHRLISAAEYVGAGTVEFMYDEKSGEFYFLEVNARLQVEHPVTELITGIDLVQWQIRIAQGEHLRIQAPLMNGDRSGISGHSIEVRIIAEDPANGFLPSIGKLLSVVGPVGNGIRFDVGYRSGDNVSQYYDSLLGKLIVHAPDRASAIKKLILALKDTHILGVKTNQAFLLELIKAEGFRTGDFDTGFLGREFSDWTPNPEAPPFLQNILETQSGNLEISKSQSRPYDLVSTAWTLNDGFRNAKVN